MAVPRISVQAPGQGKDLYPNKELAQIDAITVAVGALEDSQSVPTAIADDLDALHAIAAKETELLALAAVEADLVVLAPAANVATPASDATAAAVRTALIDLLTALKASGLMVADA